MPNKRHVPVLALLILSGCSAWSPRVEVKSTPSAADVLTADGEKIGTTPMTLSGDSLAKATRGSRLAIVVSAARHVPREISADVHGDDQYNIKLSPLDERYFNELTLKDYAGQLQEMARQLLSAQGLLLAKKLDEADAAVTTLRTHFPNLAAAYVLTANLDLLRGDSEKAKAHLRRARTLDKSDAVAARLLRQLEEEGKK